MDAAEEGRASKEAVAMDSVRFDFDLPKEDASALGRRQPLEVWLGRAALVVARYGLVLILLYLGAFKFTEVEARGIEPFVSNSPFFSWLHHSLGAQGLSNAIGVSEVGTALLIAARRLSARICVYGSLAAVATFLVTLSFLVTTPGTWIGVPGFPLPVPNELGWFLIKDVFLLGAALLSAAEALAASQNRGARS
jgi:reactive chlorine resistance protein C